MIGPGEQLLRAVIRRLRGRAAATPAHRARLYHALTAAYTTDELHTLCFTLDVNYDDLPGRIRPGKIVALIEHLDHRGRLPELVHQLQTDRPHIQL